MMIVLRTQRHCSKCNNEMPYEIDGVPYDYVNSDNHGGICYSDVPFAEPTFFILTTTDGSWFSAVEVA